MLTRLIGALASEDAVSHSLSFQPGQKMARECFANRKQQNASKNQLKGTKQNHLYGQKNRTQKDIKLIFLRSIFLTYLRFVLL
jgi:hypothetical protein